MDADLKNSILKTGTSIVGLICTDGVVLASDRRVTAGGSLVVNKNFKKILTVNDRLLTAVTGSVADAQFLLRLVSAELRLKQLKSRRNPTIKESASLLAMMSFKNIRTPSMIPAMVGALVAGVDEDGKASLYTVEPAGSISEVEEYDANFSSGMPYILGLLERQYKKDLTVEQGVELAIECLKASTQRDTASGNGIDVYTLTKDGIKHPISQEIQAVFK